MVACTVSISTNIRETGCKTGESLRRAELQHCTAQAADGAVERETSSWGCVESLAHTINHGGLQRRGRHNSSFIFGLVN
jgi:hypothetical protein